MEIGRMDLRALIAVAGAKLCWASAYAATAYTLVSFSPEQIVFTRLLIASLCFLALALTGRVALPLWRDWPALCGLGLIGMTLHHLCLAYVIKHISSGTAALLTALTPGVTAVLSMLWLGEPLGLRKLSGLGLALVGVCVVVLTAGKDWGFEPMAALMLLCVAASAIYFVGQKPYFARYGAAGVTAVTFFGATLGAMPFGMQGLVDAVLQAPGRHLGSLLWLSLVPTTVGYLAWSVALKRAPASQVSSFIYLSPPVAVLIGWLWLGERHSWLTLIGGALTMAGVVWINTCGPTASGPGRTSPNF